MPPDPDTARWMLEFILRQSDTEEWLVKEIFSVLPLINPLPFDLYLTLLLRRLASDLQPGHSLSLRTLHSLELLDDLHLEFAASFSSSASKSMTAAYCAVALHCAAEAFRAIGDEEDDNALTVYVKNLCRRVGDLQGTDRAVLEAEPLRQLKEEVKAAWKSRILRARLVERDTRKEAMNAVRAYLRDAEKELGPPFLEMAADAVIRNRIDLEEDGNEYSLESSEEEKGGLGDFGDCTSGYSQSSNEHDADEEMVNKETASSSKKIVDKGKGIATAREPDAAAIQLGSSDRRFNPLQTPEIEKVVDALKSSCSELKMVVNDPLPDAIKIATKVSANRIEEVANARQPERRKGKSCAGGPSAAGGKGSEPNDADKCIEQGGRCDAFAFDQELHGEKQLNNASRVEADNLQHLAVKSSNQATGVKQNQASNGAPRRSIMERNPTAHTMEWGNDSIDPSSQKSPASPERVCLPSPRRKAASPLKLVDQKNFLKRRKIKKWSLLEEDVLRKAIEKHGKGNWKVILNCYRDVFEDRTEVDLKDKWRNMTRH